MEFVKSKGLMTLFLTLVCILTSPAYAAEIAGHIIMVKGDVAASADGNDRPLRRRDPVFVSDTISTGENSRVQIRFIDNGLLALQANSRLSIHAYQQNADAPEQEKVLMELVEGGFRTLTGSIGKGNKAAYQVDTPVASIGVRGTLYSALVSNSRLFAGVWNGGIRLSTPDGQYDLGLDSDYAFGTLGEGGFKGMMTPPDELAGSPDDEEGSGEDDSEKESSEENGESSQDDQESDSNDSQRDDDGEDGSAGGEYEHRIPNPLDQDDDDDTLEALKKSGQVEVEEEEETPGEGEEQVDLGSPDIRLSDDEYTAVAYTTEFGLIVTGEGAAPAAVIRDDNDQPVFLTVDGESVDITRFDYSDTAAVISVPEGVSDVSWGIWNGSASTPVSQYLTDNSLEVTHVETPVYWVVAEATQSSVVAGMTGLVSFSGTSALGSDSNADSIMFSSGSFDLDFDSGAISNGTLDITYGNDIDGMVSNWYGTFDGTIRATGETNTAEALMEMNYGNLTLYNAEAMYDIDLTASQISGILTGPAAEAFIGAFHLQSVADMETGDVYSADGLLAWPALDAASIGDSIELAQ